MRFSAVFLVSLFISATLALELESNVRPHRALDSALPGVRGVISQNGANYVLNSALPVVFSKVKGLNIPEVDGSKSVPVLGDIDYHLNNIKINQLSYQAAGVTLQNEITASVTGVSVAITADWGYRQSNWPHISSSGSADISISNSGLTISLKTGVTSSGSPQLYVDNVQCDFEKLDISVHGSIISWLYDLIFDIAKGTIKSQAASAVASELTNLINGMADQALANLTLVIPVSTQAQFDLELVQAPALENSNLVVGLKAQFENKTNPIPAPLPHVNFPDTLPTMHTLLQIDQFLFASGLYLLYSSGMMDTVVTQANLPPQVPFTLNTSTFSEIVPELAKAFPNAGIEWRISPNYMPSANITGQGVAVQAGFQMDWLATDKSGNYQPAFGVNLDVALLAQLTLNATCIGGVMSVSNFNMALVSSEIGPVDLTTLNVFFSSIISGPIMDLINQQLSQGVPYPVVAGITLVNPKLIYHESYAEMDADLHVAPTFSMIAALDRVVAARPAHPGKIHLSSSTPHHKRHRRVTRISA